jgi:hypothetical protein
MPAADQFSSFSEGLMSPADNAVAVTPNDSTDLTYVTRCVYVGGAGNVTVTMAGGGSNVAYVAVPAGTFMPIRVSRILSTGTTATSILALY